MFTIVKNEIYYHKVRLTMSITLPVLYLALVMMHNDFNFEKEVYARVLFPLLFGMLPIVLIAITWVISIKELRIRKFTTLPLSSYKLILGKLLTAITPLTILVVFGLTFLPAGDSEWSPITDRILYQYGTTSILVSTLYFVYEFLNTIKLKSDVSIIVTGIPFFVAAAAFVFFTDDALWQKISQSHIGVIYAIAGVFILITGGYFFTRRNTFLV